MLNSAVNYSQDAVILLTANYNFNYELHRLMEVDYRDQLNAIIQKASTPQIFYFGDQCIFTIMIYISLMAQKDDEKLYKYALKL